MSIISNLGKWCILAKNPSVCHVIPLQRWAGTPKVLVGNSLTLSSLYFYTMQDFILNLCLSSLLLPKVNKHVHKDQNRQ